jgi:hypothetical protein
MVYALKPVIRVYVYLKPLTLFFIQRGHIPKGLDNGF